MTRKSISHSILVEEVLSDPEARAEYEVFKIQLELADKLKKARQAAHLTQKKVASKATEIGEWQTQWKHR